MLPLGSAGYVDAPLPEPQQPTLYAKTGDSPAYLAVLLLLGVAFVTQRQRTDAKPIDRANNRT